MQQPFCSAIKCGRKRKKPLNMKKNRIDVIIPTYRPGEELIRLLEALEAQTVPPETILLMNTEEELLRPFLQESKILERFDKLVIRHVKKEEFDHGRTRHLGVSHSKAPFFLCMTQDAVPANHRLIEELLKGLEEEGVAVSYARQLPRQDCSLLERYTREFNYPSESRIKSAEDLDSLGIKTYFCSNVCAAYNRRIYEECGGFIQKTIFNEDMIYAARAIDRGYRIAYCADARVIHSHNYSGKQQFHRNFDLGVSQADHPEIFGKVTSEREGGRMVKRVLGTLLRQGRLILAFRFVYQSGCKWLGYRLGKGYKSLPVSLCKVFSMEKNYWRI